MELRDYQEAASYEIAEKLQKHKICYLAWEERTGKTLAACEGAWKYHLLNTHDSKLDNDDMYVRLLVITTAKARDNTWKSRDFGSKPVHPRCRIESYSFNALEKEQINLMDPNNRRWDVIIIDEAHNFLSQVPKLGKYGDCAMRICRNLTMSDIPIIFISATPYANHVGQLYQQLSLSYKSPYNSGKYRSYYDWYREFGRDVSIRINGIDIKQYDKFTDEMQRIILHDTSRYFMFKTRKDVGFAIAPKDQVHYVDMDPTFWVKYKQIKENKFLNIEGIDIVGDTASKVLHSLSMLEGGTVLGFKDGDDCSASIAEDSKIRYILNQWGDTEDLCIMYYYQQEKKKLEEYFSKATILQCTANAESITLEHKHLVIYSQDWRASKYIQRRARQCSLKRTEPINVHYLLVKGGVSEKIYDCVAKKGVSFHANRDKQYNQDGSYL